MKNTEPPHYKLMNQIAEAQSAIGIRDFNLGLNDPIRKLFIRIDAIPMAPTSTDVYFVMTNIEGFLKKYGVLSQGTLATYLGDLEQHQIQAEQRAASGPGFIRKITDG